MTDEELAWRLGARVSGADYRVFRTAFVDAEHPHGMTKRFSLIEAVDWVNVIALTPGNDVVLIRQYRVGIGKVCLEIPGGMVDAGEDARAAAARELVEETGYTAEDWQHLATVAPNPAIQNNYLHSFVARGARKTHEPELDSSEVVSVTTVPLAEVTTLLRSGAIEHALVVAAFGHLAFAQHELR